MRKVISCCCLVLVLAGLHVYLTSQAPQSDPKPAEGTGRVAAGDGHAMPAKGASKVSPLLLGMGSAVAVVLPVACGKGPTGPPPPTRTISLRREAVFQGVAGCLRPDCSGTSNAHELFASTSGILEVTLTSGRSRELFLRVLSPSNDVIEATPSSVVRIPARPGRWVISVWQRGDGREQTPYQLRVLFP